MKIRGSGNSTEQFKPNSWRPRDYVAAAVLFLGSAAFVLWQNARVAVLWDLSYLLDTSWRIALGQMPYRDFPLVHAPLTFLIQALIMRVGGRHYLLVVLYAAVMGGTGTVLAWRVVLSVLRGTNRPGARVTSLMLSSPLILVGIYAIYPHPIYDCDCALAILLAVALLLRLDHAGRTLALSSGAACVLPVFFKQNMGLPFLATVAAGMVVLASADGVRAKSWQGAVRSKFALVLAGMFAALLVGLGIISGTAGLGNYWHWTVEFAAQRRLPGLGSMLAVYRQPSFVWTVPALAAGLAVCHTRWVRKRWGRVAALALLAAPLAGSLIYLVVQDDADERADNLLALWPLWLLAALAMAVFGLRRGVTLRRLMPLFVLAAIHGTFLSQQLWGSTYALWALLLVLVAGVLASLPDAAWPVSKAMTAVVWATFAVCGGFYAISLERLEYVRIPDAPMEHARTTALRGMADRGPYLGNLEELLEFAGREIPPGDALLLLPGEDPFYFATGRAPQFPVTLMDPTTDPYGPAELMEEARRRGVRWVIVKRELQSAGSPMPEETRTIMLVQPEYVLQRELRGYDLYRRR